MKQPEPPTHLPPSYLDIFQMMESEGTLSVTRRRFFEDVRLKSFWEKVDAYTNSVNYQFNRSDVAGTLTGAFFISIEFYGQHGTADNPSPTGQIVQNQKEVDKLIIDALNKAGELLDIFERIQVKSAYYPEEIESLYFGEFNVSTRDVLLKLNHGLADYPTYKILFADNRGLIGSQSDTYIDWFYAVKDSLKRMNSMYSGNFNLSLNDWAKLYCIFFEPELDLPTAKDRIKKSINHLTT